MASEALLQGSASQPSATWQMVQFTPALLGTITSVIALAASFFYECPYMAIPAGVGLLASFYAFYLTDQYAKLQSLERSVQKLERLTETQKQTEEKLQKNLQTLKSQLVEHKAQMKSLKAEYQRQINELKAFNTSLKLIAEQGADHNQTFQKHLEALNSKIESLDETQENSRSHLSTLQETATTLQGLFNKDALLKILQKIAGAAGELKGQRRLIGELENQIVDLKKAAKALNNGVNRLSSQVDRLENV